MATSKFDPLKAASLSFTAQTTNNFAAVQSGNLYVGPTKASAMRALLAYDLYGMAAEGRPIRPTDTITAVQIDFSNITVHGGSGVQQTVNRITRDDWEPRETTWNVYKSGNNWTAGGGDVDGATPTPLTPAGPTGATWSLTGLVNFATDAVSNRLGRIHIRIRPTTESDDGITDMWSTNTYGELQNYLGNALLVVTYTPGDEPPISD